MYMLQLGGVHFSSVSGWGRRKQGCQLLPDLFQRELCSLLEILCLSVSSLVGCYTNTSSDNLAWGS